MWKFDGFTIVLQNYESPRHATKALVFHPEDWELSFEYRGAGVSQMRGSTYREAGGNLEVVEVVIGLTVDRMTPATALVQ